MPAAEEGAQGAMLPADQQQPDDDNTNNIEQPGHQQQQPRGVRPAPVSSFASTRHLDISRHLSSSGGNSEGGYDFPMKSSRRDSDRNGSRVGGASGSSSRERAVDDKNRDNNADGLRENSSEALRGNRRGTGTSGEHLSAATAAASAAAVQPRKHKDGTKNGQESEKLDARDRLDGDREIVDVETGAGGDGDESGYVTGNEFELDVDELEELEV